MPHTHLKEGKERLNLAARGVEGGRERVYLFELEKEKLSTRMGGRNASLSCRPVAREREGGGGKGNPRILRQPWGEKEKGGCLPIILKRGDSPYRG